MCERRSWVARLCSGAVLLLLGLTSSACSDKLDPEVGSESHFLIACSSSRDCGALSCIEHVCTRSCTLDGDCADLASATECLPAADAASGSVCDVACGRDAECAPLGELFACQDQRCRERSADGSMPGGGGTGGDSGDGDGDSMPGTDGGPELDEALPLDAATRSDSATDEPSDAPGTVAAQRYEGFEHRTASAMLEVDLSLHDFEAVAAEDGTIYTTGGFEGENGIRLMRYDENFVLIGETVVDAVPHFGGPFVFLTLDSEGHVIVASTERQFSGNGQPNVNHLLRFTPDGELEWVRSWRRWDADAIYDLFATSDGRLLVATEAFMNMTSSTTKDSIIFEYDLAGTLQRETTYGGADFLDRYPRVHALADATQVVAWGDSNGAGSGKLHWSWTDPSGTVLPPVTLVDPGALVGLHATEAREVFLVENVINHFAEDGTLIQQMDPSNGGQIVRLQHLADGGFIVNGVARVTDLTDPMAATLFVARYEASGELSWRTSYDSHGVMSQPPPVIVRADGTLYTWFYGTNLVDRYDPRP